MLLITLVSRTNGKQRIYKKGVSARYLMSYCKKYENLLIKAGDTIQSINNLTNHSFIIVSDTTIITGMYIPLEEVKR